MDEFRVYLSLSALAACLAFIGWLAICVLSGRKHSAGFVLAQVLLSLSLLFAACVNWFAAKSFPLPSSNDLVILLAVSVSLAARFGLSARGRGWNVAIAHGLLVTAAVWNFHATTLQNTPDIAFTPPAEKVAVNDAVVVTDQGRIFSVFRFDTNDHTFAENAQDVFQHKIVQVAAEDLQSNCHGWVFANGRYGVPADAVAALLQDNGYVNVPSPQPDDVIVYRNEAGEILHTGRVRRVHEDGRVWIESKWGPGGRYLHSPEDQCYSSNFAYYRSPRVSHEAQIVQISATKDSRVARTGGAPLRRVRG